MKSQTVQALGCVAVLLLSACGGGGGSGGGGGGGGGGPTVTGNGFAPTTGPGDSAGYYPVGAGDQWQYDFSTTDPKASAPTGVVSLAVNGTKTVLGATATVLIQTNSTSPSGGFDEYFAVSPGGVTNLGNTNAGDTITPLIVPYVQLLFPVQLGMQSSLTGQNLPLGNDASGHAITLDVTQTIANSSFESVDVPAGSYANALKQVTTVSGTAHDNGQSLAVSGTETTWLVAGIGVVKDTNSAATVAQTITSTAELRAATVNGQTHGFGAAANLATVIPAGDMSGSQPLSPAITSDGTNYLIVTVQRAISGGAETQNWIGTLVAPNGTSTSFNVTAPGPLPPPTSPVRAVAGFDGANYLIVYETDHTPALPTLDAVVVSPSGVTLAGPHTVATANDGPAGARFEALAGGGGQYLLVYPQQVAGGNQLYGVLVGASTAQAIGAAFAIAPGTAPQASVAAAFDGTNYLVAWDEQSAAPGLKAVRVSSAGTVLDASPLVVFNEVGACCGDLTPSVTFDGSNYLVVYRDTRGETGSLINNATVSAARVSPGGTLLDGSATTPGIVVTTTKGVALGNLSSAYMLGAHWIVWQGADTALHGSRVSTAGTVPADWTDGFALAPSGAISYPTLATRGTDGYLVWISGTQVPIAVAGLRVFGP